MSYKMIMCDLDGTMFGSDYKAHEDNIRSIKKSVDNGKVFAIASGRPYLSVQKVAESLGLDREGQYVICFNGALIAEAATGKPVYSLCLTDEYSHRIIMTAKEKNVSVIAYINGEPFSYRDDDEVAAYFTRVGIAATVDETLYERKAGGFDKVLLRGAPEKLKEVEEALSEWADGRVAYVYSDAKMLEYFNIDVSKGRAMLILAEKLGIRKEEIIAIGDYYNDVAMLEAAGLGVAVKNAPDAVKNSAGYVTVRTAEEGAVSEVIERFVFGKV